MRRSKRISLRVPPGVDSGRRLRVRSEGNAGRRGGPPGAEARSAPYSAGGAKALGGESKRPARATAMAASRAGFRVAGPGGDAGEGGRRPGGCAGDEEWGAERGKGVGGKACRPRGAAPGRAADCQAQAADSDRAGGARRSGWGRIGPSEAAGDGSLRG